MNPSIERIIPERSNNDLIYAQHLNRYIFASQFCAGKIVADVGCGVGYGARYLSSIGVKKIYAIDKSTEAIDYAKKNFSAPSIDYQVAEAENLSKKIKDKTVDVVVAFELIEHLYEQEVLLKEISRILKPEGLALISTPNLSNHPAGNPFHVKELTKDDLCKLLNKHFTKISLFYQGSNLADSIFSINDAQYTSNLNPLHQKCLKIVPLDPNDCEYFIAICTNGNTMPDVQSNTVIFNSHELAKYKKLLTEKDRLIQEQYNVVRQKDELIKKQDQFVRERDELIKKQDALIRQLNTPKS
jgi:2-polyprenyl-3-methyl-5-hydroxy-6-metoxy-1,4-benzoquinol methylase